MKIRSSKPIDARSGAGPRIVPLQFQRSHWPGIGLHVAGLLDYSIDGCETSARLSMTWEALAMLRDEVEREGLDVSDESLIARTLTQWGCEQIAKVAAAGKALAFEPLVLEFKGGPLSPEPRRLLESAALLGSVGESGQSTAPDSYSLPRGAPRTKAGRFSWGGGLAGW